MSRFIPICFALSLCACASEQLNYNTLDIAANVDSLYTKQILENVSKFIDNKNAFPSSLSVSLGTVSTTDTLTPTVTFPVTSSIATAASTAVAAVTRTTTTAGAGAGLTATNTQMQNWSVAPLSDANTLRNYQAIYRYALYGTNLLEEYKPVRLFLNLKFVPDPYQFQYPHCVLCASDKKQGQFFQDQSAYDLHVNENLPKQFIYWRSDPGAIGLESMPADGLSDPSDLVDLGHYGDHELFITREAYKAGLLTKFVFFLLPNSEPAESFAQVVIPPAPLEKKGFKPAVVPQVIPGPPATNQRFTPFTQQPNFPLVVPSN